MSVDIGEMLIENGEKDDSVSREDLEPANFDSLNKNDTVYVEDPLTDDFEGVKYRVDGKFEFPYQKNMMGALQLTGAGRDYYIPRDFVEDLNLYVDPE